MSRNPLWLIGIISLFILTSPHISLAATEIGGDQYDGQGGPWIRQNEPYIVTDWVTIPAGETLTIEPGVAVEFQTNLGIGVYGTLNALGSSQAVIHFMSEGDHSPNVWNSIQFYDGSGGTLDYCVVRYGGAYEDCNIRIAGNASPTISNSEIALSGDDGIRVYDNGAPTIRGCLITENVDNGIGIYGNAHPVLIDSQIYDNSTPVWIHSGTAVPQFSNNHMSGNRDYDAVCFSGSIPDGTHIEWDLASVPYVIATWVDIGINASLTIPAGAVLKFQDNQGIGVYGTLTAMGTSGQRIIFTDERDDAIDNRDTNVDGSDTAPEGDWWNSLQFHDGSSGTLNYCVVRYGGAYEDCNIRIAGNASPTISNSEIALSGDDGIRVYDNGAPTIRGCFITENVDNGIGIYGNAHPVLIDNQIYDNDTPVWLHSGAAVPEFSNNHMSGNRNWDAVGFSGDIPDDTHIEWSLPDVPYVIAAWVDIGVNASLTIPAGAVLKFQDNQGIGVYGTLIAAGTSSQRIVFTDERDDAIDNRDTNVDGSDSVPDGNWWNSLQFHDGSSGTLNYCVVRYGGAYEDCNIRIAGNASPTISNSEIALSGDDGVRVYDSGAPTIQGCLIAENGDDGIGIYASAHPVLIDNQIYDNGTPVWIYSGMAVPQFSNNHMKGNRSYDGIGFSGSIPDNTHIEWDLPSVPYVIAGWVDIGVNASLTLPAGAVLKFQDNQGIGVYGTLTAAGTSGQRIVFTDERDDAIDNRDTNVDGSDTAPEGDWWNSLQFHDGSSGTLDYCVVRYGGAYEDCNIRIAGNASPTISNSEIALSGDDGIRVYDSARPVLSPHNSIMANSAYGVQNLGSATVNARDNWWGDPSGPYHETSNPDGQGNEVSDRVDFAPYMSTAPTQPSEDLLITEGPFVSAITSTSATISWVTNKVSTSEVSLSVGPNNDTRTGSDGTNHQVTLTNLSPATTYSYHVVSRDTARNVVTSASASFTTASTGPARALSITSVEVAPGDQATVQLSISDASGVAGGDIALSYDPTVLSFIDASTLPLAGNLSLVHNATELGVLVLGLAGAQGIATGRGGLIELSFRAAEDASVGTQTEIRFSQASLSTEVGDPIPVITQQGVVEIGLACVKGDVNGDGRTNSVDAIFTLRIAVGLETATPTQQCAADMNDDGRVNSVDAILILRKAVGLPLASPTRQTLTDRAQLTLEQMGDGSADIVEIRLSLSGAQAHGADIMLVYDPDYLTLLGANTEALDLVAANTRPSGQIRLSVAGLDIDSSSAAPLFKMQFRVMKHRPTVLTVTRFSAYNSEGHSLTTQRKGQQLSIQARPEVAMLGQNFPNPFNPETWIPYQIAQDDDVRIQIHDVTGRLVRRLELGSQTAGYYVTPGRAAYWDGRDSQGRSAASGVYFYTIHTTDFRATRRMIIVK